MRRKIEDERMQECPFKPQVQKTSKAVPLNPEKMNRKPIYERVGHIQKEKNEHLQRLRIEAEKENKDLTFKPRINDESEKIVEDKREGSDERETVT